jgi:hypothetical protein
MPNPSRRNRLPAQLRLVRAFYAKGRDSRKRSSDRLGYGEATRSAEDMELRPEMLRKARQIAQEFPAEKFKRLLERCETRDFAIGITHLMRLASVNKGRSALITRMINGRWSLRRLNTEIAKVHPSIEGRGRRRHVAEDQEGRLIELKRECDRWLRWRLSTGDSTVKLGNGDDGLEQQQPLGRAVSQAVREVRDKILQLRAVLVRSLRNPNRRPKS